VRLEHLCDLELIYREMPGLGTKFVLGQPYGTEEGTGYGEGDGQVSGTQLNGTLRWVNHPHRRSDGTMLPDAHGVILTDDGAMLLFSLQGRTTFVGDQGQQLLRVLFETDAERYRWLNSALCVLEGQVEAARMGIRAQVFVCVSELA
jgi:hypothetical protein